MIANTIQIRRVPEQSVFRLEARQWLPVPRKRMFEFFSDAYQLETLTPPWLNFSVLTPAPIEMREGALIDYKLRLRGIPLTWQSRISVWDPPHRFVDEQLRGPYRLWYHQHILEDHDSGTLCHDIVDYRVPGGWLIHQLLVRRDLIKIFTYRQNILQQLFRSVSAPALAT